MGLPSLFAPPATGKKLTSVIVTPLTVSDLGATTAGTALTITTYVEALEMALEKNKEEISGMNTGRLNEIKVSEGFRGSVQVLQVLNGDVDDLHSALMAVDYVRLVWTFNGVTKTLYAGLGNLNLPLSGRGKQNYSFDITPADFGANTYVES